MQIVIDYEASWRNSFLDGAPSSKGRNFIASMADLKQSGNYIQRTVTKDTVMGVLNRLIGEQRRLYQARLKADYYFSEIESVLKESDIIDQSINSDEVIYLRNLKRSKEKKSFSGVIKTSDPWLNIDYAKEFWRILWMDLDELLQFIQGENFEPKIEPKIDPLSIFQRFEEVEKIRTPVTDEINQAAKILSNRYPKFILKEFNNKISALSLYCSALYLILDKLSIKYDVTAIKAPKGGLTGISHNNFTPRDFMGRFATGGPKTSWGNPYILKEKKKGEGEVTSVLTKASGKLIINLNISKELAIDLEEKIKNAGVSSFYLGKKGIAYVSNITTEEIISK